MPNGLWYASGPCRRDERKAGSAFSKGDVLTLDSNSSLSRINPYAWGTAALYGVATADSTDSIKDGKVGCIVVQPTTRFWARLEAGDTFVTGGESSLSFVVGSGRYFVDTTVTSGTSASVVCINGTDDIDQSVQSKVILQFKFADSELDLS